jgi:hypothetical protein
VEQELLTLPEHNLDHHWFNTVVPEQLGPPLVLVEIEFLTL